MRDLRKVCPFLLFHISSLKCKLVFRKEALTPNPGFCLKLTPLSINVDDTGAEKLMKNK